jgi:hypothetical protein
MFFPTHLEQTERIRITDPHEIENAVLELLIPEHALTDYYEDKMDFDVGVGD